MADNVQFSKIVAQVVTDDLYTYVLDNQYKHLVKLEYTGDIVTSFRFEQLSFFNETSLQLSRDNELLVYDVGNTILYNIDPLTLAVTNTRPLSGLGRNIILDIYGNIIQGDWVSAAVDNQNFLYTIESNPTQDDLSVVGFTSGVSFDLVNPLIDQYTNAGFTNTIYKYDLTELTENSLGIQQAANFTKTPLIFTNDNYEQIQFLYLYPNSGIDGVISKPFNPQRLFITKENEIIILNDTREVLRLEANPNKPVRFVSYTTLFDNDIWSGKNLVDLQEEGLGERYADYVNTPLWPSVSGTYVASTSINATYEYNPATEAFETYFWIVDSQNKALYKTTNSFEIRECFSLPAAIDSLAYPGEIYSQYRFTLPPATTYEWHRKFDWLASNEEDFGFGASVYTLDEGVITKHSLVFGGKLADDQWYHTALTYDRNTGKICFYVDNILADTAYATPGSTIYSFYETGAMIGTKQLRANSINNELNCSMYGFEGSVYDVRIYDIALSQSKLAQIILSSQKIEDLEWNLPIGVRNYIERVERFLMNRHPGNASQFYKIRLSGLSITDPVVRADIERIIRDTIHKVAPATATLYSIEWQ